MLLPTFEKLIHEFANSSLMFNYYKIILACLIFITGICKNVFGNEIDSLNNLLNSTHEISKKIEIYTSLSKAYQLNDLGKAREMANLALNLSKNTDSEEYLGEIYACLGDITIMLDSIETAKNYYETARTYFEAAEDVSGLAGVTLVLGNIAYLRDNLSEAMQHYMRAIDYAEESGLIGWLPHINMNIGSINLKAGNYPEALSYYLISLESIGPTEDSIVVGKALSNIGIVYSNLGQLDLAQEYTERGLEVYLAIGAGVETAVAYSDLARLDQLRGNYDEALVKLEKGLDLILTGEHEYAGPKSQALSAIYLRLAESHLALENKSTARQYYQKALSIGHSNEQTATISQAALGLSDYWNLNNNSDSALYYYRIYKAYSDSVANQENIRKLAYQDAQFKYEQQLSNEKQRSQQQAEKQKRNQLLLMFVIVLLVMLLIVSSLFIKLGRNKVKRIELEQQTLKRELELRNKELATHVIYQVKNNEFILNLSKKLQKTIGNLKPENRPLINEVIKEIEFDSSQDAWKEFEVRFQRVHSGFSKKLTTKYPDLTANELRLCSFLRLNMNTKDIAAITYQSTNSIDVARSRLRQKLGLDKDENLVAFLSQF